MPIHSLNNLLKMFPYFFDKSETSNFYKSQKVTNNIFKKIYNDLQYVYESFHLNKRLLVWKEQEEPYNYTMRFVCKFPLLKSIEIYCDESIIYEGYFELSEDNSFSCLVEEVFHEYFPVEVEIPIEDSDEEFETVVQLMHDSYIQEHSFDEKITIFDYSYNTSSDSITSSEKYQITVNTFDEYSFTKGFPENDEPAGNIYDHDISLDEFGEENNIPRRNYLVINEEEYSQNELIEYYSSTDPHYNNQATEDDYHYMKRIISYLIKYHTVPLPVLEIWKLYGVDATLVNRDKHILRLFDEELHPPNEEGIFDWVPQPWEHKDFFVEEKSTLGEYFFVSANTVQPVKKQGMTFYLKFTNSIAEILTSDLYSVDIFLNGELLAEDYTNSQYPVHEGLLSDSVEGNLFTFHAKKDNTVFKTINVLVKVRGCGDSDFYVNANSTSEIEDGSLANPFKTLEKAIKNVNGAYNLIVIYGDVELESIPVIVENCTIIGCGNARIINNIDSSKFFNIALDKKVILQDITLVTTESIALLDNDIFTNNNILDLNETVVTTTVDYGVLLSDLPATTFIKNIEIRNNKIYYTEIEKEDLHKLSDLNGIIQDVNLDGNQLTFNEYSPATNDDYNLNLQYIDLNDRLKLEKTVKKLEIENYTIKSTEYGDELAWKPLNHSI